MKSAACWQTEHKQRQVPTLIIRLGLERLVPEMLEREATDDLEREHYRPSRREQEYRSQRHPHEPGSMRAAEVEIVVPVPQVQHASETYPSRFQGES